MMREYGVHAEPTVRNALALSSPRAHNQSTLEQRWRHKETNIDGTTTTEEWGRREPGPGLRSSV